MSEALRKVFHERVANKRKALKEEIENSADENQPAQTVPVAGPAAPEVPQVSPVAAAEPPVSDDKNIPEIVGSLVDNPWSAVVESEGSMTVADKLAACAKSDHPLAQAVIKECEMALQSPQFQEKIKKMRDAMAADVQEPSKVTEWKKYNLHYSRKLK
jgi:hypothetical protein